MSTQIDWSKTNMVYRHLGKPEAGAVGDLLDILINLTSYCIKFRERCLSGAFFGRCHVADAKLAPAQLPRFELFLFVSCSPSHRP